MVILYYASLTVKQLDALTHRERERETYSFQDPPDDAPIKLHHMEAIVCEIENRDRNAVVMSPLYVQSAVRVQHKIRQLLCMNHCFHRRTINCNKCQIR